MDVIYHCWVCLGKRQGGEVKRKDVIWLFVSREFISFFEQLKMIWQLQIKHWFCLRTETQLKSVCCFLAEHRGICFFFLISFMCVHVWVGIVIYKWSNKIFSTLPLVQSHIAMGGRNKVTGELWPSLVAQDSEVHPVLEGASLLQPEPESLQCTHSN